MLYIFSFFVMSLSAAVNIKCPTNEGSFRAAVCSSTKVVYESIETTDNSLVDDIIASVCIKTHQTVMVRRSSRASNAGGLGNLFQLMMLPIGMHNSDTK
jgi:hypothetical protein